MLDTLELSSTEEWVDDLNALGIYVQDYEMYTARQLAEVLPAIQTIARANRGDLQFGLAA